MLITTNSLSDFQMGELHISDAHGSKVIPTYTCAHCNKVVMLRPDRTRPRVRCQHCSGYICEKSKFCQSDCTPIWQITRDHFDCPEPMKQRALKALSGEIYI